jgi:hypothetical protein
LDCNLSNASAKATSTPVVEEDDDSVFNIKTEPSMSKSSHADPMANLVYTKTGSGRLTDQNTDLYKVIQHSILEVKAYIAFKQGYPELVAKNLYACEILLQAAKHHKTVLIEKWMYVDDEYLLALANLVSDLSYHGLILTHAVD